MMIRVRFFALAAQRTGVREATLELPGGFTVAQARTQLESQLPVLAELREGLAAAVNMAYVGPAHILMGGDELALIPPVSGG